jgi:HSP20 family protein
MARSYLPSLFGREGESLGSLFREVEKTFEDFSRRSPFAPFMPSAAEVMAPRIDISETKDALEITAELPGTDEKDLEITLSEGMLTIRGEKKSERDEEDTGKNWHVIERSYGAFSRSIALPFEPESGKVEAKFDKGVLRIRLPKPPEVAKKQQKIEIKKG